MRTILGLLFVALGFGVNAYSSTDSIPPFRASDCLGVNIHFLEPQEKDLDPIQQAGFKMIRMDFGWASVERQKGEYDYSGYQRLTEALRKRSIVPIYILDYSNPLYEKEQSVLTEEGRQAFARFAAGAVKAMGGSPIIWEIWNEPNINQFWVKPNPAQYVLLVEAAAKAMRAASPRCTIAAPATSEIPFEFLEACYDRGLLRWIDAVSVHPYRTRLPETALEDYKTLRELTDRYCDGRNKPILSGEWGYSVHEYKDFPVSEHQQAQYLVRQFLINFAAGVRVSIWYDWQDDGPDPKEREHNFGTVKQDYTPKESYKAAQTLSRELQGLSPIRFERDPESQIFWAEFGKNQKSQVIVGWTTGDPVTVPLKKGNVKPDASAMLGGSIRLEKKNGFWMAPLSQDPIYIHLGR
jgi:polysaccharide biosynthesis protein PslG